MNKGITKYGTATAPMMKLPEIKYGDDYQTATPASPNSPNCNSNCNISRGEIKRFFGVCKENCNCNCNSSRGSMQRLMPAMKAATATATSAEVQYKDLMPVMKTATATQQQQRLYK